MQRGISGIKKRTREEVLYWKNLTPVFKVDLRGDFRSRLDIPLYFSENVKGRLPCRVALRGPSDDIDTWEVHVRTTNDITSLVGEGWKTFVAAFSLEENDTLVFKYKNNSYFKVKVINGKTSCERESSHFVTSSTAQTNVAAVSERGQPKAGCPAPQTNGLTRERRSEEYKSGHPSSRPKKDVPMLSSFKRNYADFELKPAKGNGTCRSAYAERMNIRSSSENLAPQRSVKVKTDAECISAPIDSSHWIQAANAIERARQRAKGIQMATENSFYISLARSHVYGKMKVGIPIRWWNAVIKSQRSLSIELRLKGKDQRQSHACYCCYDESHKTATITTGWKNFVQENFLRECDCCVFRLAKPWHENEVICMEVEIVRAIE